MSQCGVCNGTRARIHLILSFVATRNQPYNDLLDWDALVYYIPQAFECTPYCLFTHHLCSEFPTQYSDKFISQTLFSFIFLFEDKQAVVLSSACFYQFFGQKMELLHHLAGRVRVDRTIIEKWTGINWKDMDSTQASIVHLGYLKVQGHCFQNGSWLKSNDYFIYC